MGELLNNNPDSGEESHELQNSHQEVNSSDKEKMLPTMKKELSKKELKIEEREKLKDIKSNLELTKDLQCGIGFIRGKFLQKFANQETFVVVYGILGATINAVASYFSGNLSTLEKRFRIPSQNIGYILTGNDITALLFGILITYYAGKKHKPRWICVGMLFISSFSIISTFPHFIYGSGNEALALTKEYEKIHANASRNATDSSLCTKGGPECVREGSLMPQVLFFVAQLMWGIGAPLYGNLGMAYMDDNIKRSKTPVLISFSFFIRMLGPVGGYALASWCLSKYISPQLTPTITKEDPRWVGAWWLGFIIISIIMLLFSFLVALFPKELPTKAIRRILEDQTKDEITKKQEKEEEEEKASWKDMKITFGRLFRNKVLMCNTAASCFYVAGYYPYWTFMPKYIEIQYRVSASFASLVTGVVGLVCTALGIMCAGGFITKVRPRARSLAAFNILAGVIAMFGVLSYTFLGCVQGDEYNLRISKANQNVMTTCNTDCNCEFSRYAPVCSLDGTNTTYISACHAGCRSSITINQTKIYQNCSCIATIEKLPYSVPKFAKVKLEGILGGSASMGACPIDCTSQFFIFLSVVCLLKFVGSAAKTSNVLLSVRCVEERDKAVSMSFGMTVLSLFAFIPAPIIYGWIMDQTCILWGKTCSATGSCWVYDAAHLRALLNTTTMTLLAVSNIFDIAVWYYVKDIQIFDEEVGKTKKHEKKKESDVKNSKEQGKNSNYSPLNQNAA